MFELPPGFRVELVAAEPLVQDPVAIRFDERGRLWVIEWPDYNKQLRGVIPGLENIAPAFSRLVVLEDTDGDGRMDRRTVFMDGVEWLRGMEFVRDGVLVLKLPKLVFARDTDGDGKADFEQTLADGLEIPGNPQAAQSNLLREMDNWFYGSKFPHRLRPDGSTWLDRPHPSMRGQWGVSQDNYGRIFYASNQDHLRGDLIPGHYYTRNPNYPSHAGTDVPYPHDQFTWPHAATPGTNRRNQQRDKDGTLEVFTCNTRPTVYRGDQFPAEYAGNVFLGDCAGRLIRRSVLTEKDGMITAANAYDRREFLFSNDERFRPVYTANGPDGALYITDMYRGIIEGHLFITTYLRQQIIARGLQTPFNGLGRIYRVVYEGRKPAPAPKFERDNVAAWVAHLAHPNGFWRTTAQRLIVDRGDRRAVPALRTMARSHASELARLHALWTLEGLGAIDADILGRAMADTSFRVRQAAVRIAEPFLADPAIAPKVLALASDPRIEVRRQLLLSLGEGRGPAIDAAMLALLQRDAGAPITIDAALSGLAGREVEFLDRVLRDSEHFRESPGVAQLLGALAKAVLNSGKDADIGRVLGFAGDASQHAAWARVAVLDGMVAGEARGMSRLLDRLGPLDQSSDATVRQRAANLRHTWSVKVAAPTARRKAVPTGAVFDKGQALFAICAACHGPEGKGQPAIAPPLAESKIVAAAPDEIMRSVLFGRNQDRKNTAFPEMPPLGGLPDADIAAVISYVRARFGSADQPILAEQITKLRAEGMQTAAAAPR